MPQHARPPVEKPPSKRPRKFFVHVERDPKVQTARLELPVCMHEQQIMEAIHENDVVLITGATGTGKTTQVPQFLVEDGFGSPEAPRKAGAIAVTQPRRVAAVSCASRVAHEMRAKLGAMVGYHVRHDPRHTAHTRVKFVTDGILLREVENDLFLKRYSAIVVDEAHERSLNTDLLLAFLSRIVRLRRQKCMSTIGPLKVIIMSATLDVEGVFSGNDVLFPDPPVVSVPSRQYPITTHFAKRTAEDYVEAAYRKVSKIHTRLSQGGILVFLSGRQEVDELCAKLEEEFAERDVKLPDSDDATVRMKVFPFYSLLADNLQKRVFHDVAGPFRKVVVATNIAETSVTVPGISYVVDSGRAKQKSIKHSRLGYVTTFDISWISQASAQQRAGRAGRTGPGHCYRLYSSAVFDQRFPEFTAPEIARVSADAVVLRLRALGIRHVAEFPFPTRPDATALASAERVLSALGALAPHGLLGVTRLGRMLSRIPLEPRFARLLLCARDTGGPTAAALAARVAGVLSVGGVLLREASTRRNVDAVAARMLRTLRSDVLRETAALCAVEHASRSSSSSSSSRTNDRTSCRTWDKPDVEKMRPVAERLGVRVKPAVEALAIAAQVARATGLAEAGARPIAPPRAEDVCAVGRALVAAFPDRIARRMTRDEAAAAGVIPRLAGRAFAVGSSGGAACGAALLAADSVVRVGAGELVCFAEMEQVVVRRKRKRGRAQDEDDGRDDYEESEEERGEEEEEEEEDAHNDTDNGQNEGDGSCPDGERRIVLRGVSAVRSEWVASEASELCARRVARDAGVGYDAGLASVVRDASVTYGPLRWPLGRVSVAVETLRRDATSGCISERVTDGEADAFARALLGGKVVETVRVAADEIGRAKREAAVRGVGRVLARCDVCSVNMLRRCDGAVVDEIAAIAAAGVGAAAAEGRRRRWSEVLRELVRGREAGEDDAEEYSDGDGNEA